MASLPDLPTELLLMTFAKFERNHLALASRICKRLDEVAGALLWKEAFLLDVISVLSPGRQVVEGAYSIHAAQHWDSTDPEQGRGYIDWSKNLVLGKLNWGRFEEVAARVHVLEHHPNSSNAFDTIGYTFRLHADILAALADRFTYAFPNLKHLTWPCIWTCQDIATFSGPHVQQIQVTGFLLIENGGWEETLNFKHENYPHCLAERVAGTLRSLEGRCPGVEIDMDVDVGDGDEDILANICGEVIEVMKSTAGWVLASHRSLPGRLVVLEGKMGEVARIGGHKELDQDGIE